MQRHGSRPPLANSYYNLIRGIGTIDWYTGIRFPERATPRYFVTRKNVYIPNPRYRGECFWLESGQSIPCKFSPHRIVTRVHVVESQTLIINQNFHRDWHVNRGILGEWNGILKISLPPGDYPLELWYLSRSFAFGILISFFTLLGLIWIARLYKRGRLNM